MLTIQYTPSPEVYSAPNRNEYQESSGRGGKARPARKVDYLAAVFESIA
jgi:hypothetical protein